MKRKLLLIALLTFILIIIISPSAFAADATISVGGSYEIDTLYGNSSTITITTTDMVILTQDNLSTPLSDFQIVYSVAGANLVLDGISINNNVNPDKCALAFMGTDNNLNITSLSGLESGENQPGIKVEDTTRLIINGSDTLQLDVIGGTYGAGIGSGNDKDAGSITINSGLIYAYGDGGAGIGGGLYGDGGTITINGGEIYAYGDGGAGIGGGVNIYPDDTFDDATGGTIKIKGGIVHAMSVASAAIGGGIGSHGGNITISDGEVYTSAEGGAGIGGGAYGDGGNITITGGYIESICHEDGAGIGGGYRGNGGNITITGGQILAVSEYEGAGIGGGDGDPSETLGNPGNGGTIKISGDAYIDAISEEEGAGIGGGNWGAGGNITISGGDIYAFGCDGAAGIGGGDDGDGGSITFYGGLFFAEGDNNDIGSGINGTPATIKIKGDSVVFLYRNLSDPITTSTHSLHDYEMYDGVDAYGYELTWWDSGTAYAYKNNYAGSKIGDLYGTLTDNSGNKLEGYKITIYSTPRTTTTNTNGVFTFSDIPYSRHILQLKDSSGNVIDQYNLIFTQGRSTGTTVSGDDINITFASYTTSVHLSFQGNGALDAFNFNGATFTGNPQTEEQTWFEWIVSAISNLFS